MKWIIRKRTIGSAHAWVVWKPGCSIPAFITGGPFENILSWCYFEDMGTGHK